MKLFKSKKKHTRSTRTKRYQVKVILNEFWVEVEAHNHDEASDRGLDAFAEDVARSVREDNWINTDVETYEQ